MDKYNEHNIDNQQLELQNMENIINKAFKQEILGNKIPLNKTKTNSTAASIPFINL